MKTTLVTSVSPIVISPIVSAAMAEVERLEARCASLRADKDKALALLRECRRERVAAVAGELDACPGICWTNEERAEAAYEEAWDELHRCQDDYWEALDYLSDEEREQRRATLKSRIAQGPAMVMQQAQQQQAQQQQACAAPERMPWAGKWSEKPAADKWMRLSSRIYGDTLLGAIQAEQAEVVYAGEWYRTSALPVVRVEDGRYIVLGYAEDDEAAAACGRCWEYRFDVAVLTRDADRPVAYVLLGDGEPDMVPMPIQQQQACAAIDMDWEQQRDDLLDRIGGTEHLQGLIQAEVDRAAAGLVTTTATQDSVEALRLHAVDLRRQLAALSASAA